jgi:DNA (cytosine-5)-methyltransferase 1
MNHLDLCSGIGGWALAFRELGINTIGFCEIDKYPQQVLQKNFPGIPIFNDLKELTYEDIKERTGVDGIDLLTCSYPCQPFSVAGKQKGEEDSRHLWPDTFRLVQECRPTWFVGENVGGHIKLGLDTVLEDLASIGYDTRTFVIPASSIGAWHQRKRIWIIGHKAVSDTKSHSSHDRELGHSKETSSEERHKRKTGGNRSNDVSDTKCKRLQGHREEHRLQETQRERETYRQSDDATSISDTSSSRLEEHGYSETEDAFQFTTQENWWQTQSELCGVPDGISYGLDKNRVGRIKGLGNAIVPQIAWFIGNAILQANGESK